MKQPHITRKEISPGPKVQYCNLKMQHLRRSNNLKAEMRIRKITACLHTCYKFTWKILTVFLFLVTLIIFIVKTLQLEIIKVFKVLFNVFSNFW